MKIANKLLSDQKTLKAMSGRIDEIMEGIRKLLAANTPRRLTDEQKRGLFEAIRPFPGQKITIFSLMNDGESIDLAQDFIEVFTQAKWIDTNGAQPNAWQGVMMGDNIGVRILIDQSDSDTLTPAADALSKYLKPTGLVTEYIPKPGVGKSVIAFIVGRKPPQAQ